MSDEGVSDPLLKEQQQQQPQQQQPERRLVEPLPSMTIFNGHQGSERLRHLTNLNHIQNLGEFLESFCGREFNAGQIAPWQILINQKINFFVRLISDMHNNTPREDITIGEVLQRLDRIAKEKKLPCGNIRIAIINNQETILREINEHTTRLQQQQQASGFQGRENQQYQRNAARDSENTLNQTGRSASVKSTVFIVYDINQEVFTRKNDPLDLDDFGNKLKEKFNQLIEIQTYDLSTYEDLDGILNQGRPTIIIYDNTLHDLLNKDPLELLTDERFAKFLRLRKFCSKIFAKYCRSNCVNEKFFAFCDGEFGRFMIPPCTDQQTNGNRESSSSYFKFNWLLQRMPDNRLVKMKPLPTSNNESFRKGLEEFHKNFSSKIISS